MNSARTTRPGEMRNLSSRAPSLVAAVNEGDPLAMAEACREYTRMTREATEYIDTIAPSGFPGTPRVPSF